MLLHGDQASNCVFLFVRGSPSLPKNLYCTDQSCVMSCVSALGEKKKKGQTDNIGNMFQKQVIYPICSFPFWLYCYYHSSP